MVSKSSPRTNRRMGTKGKAGAKVKRVSYYKKFRGGNNRTNNKSA